MRPSLSGTLALLDLSKPFAEVSFPTFLWSFTDNVVAILLAAGAFPKAQIPPQFAELGKVFSVLPVTAIAGLFRFEGVKQHLN
jgi:Cd2+-exporting ATPase